MKLTLTSRKPRNPFAVTARMRRAGAHRESPTARRQQADRALQRELQDLRRSP